MLSQVQQLKAVDACRQEKPQVVSASTSTIIYLYGEMMIQFT